jgi:hypothetical protein
MKVGDLVESAMRVKEEDGSWTPLQPPAVVVGLGKSAAWVILSNNLYCEQHVSYWLVVSTEGEENESR